MDEKYTDIGATTPEAMDISRRSRKIISEIVGDRTPEDRIRQRCAIATGDPSVAEIMRFVKDPISAGLRALDEKARIFVDINMVKDGVVKKGHQCSITAMIGKGDDLAEKDGITRTSAGVLAFQSELSGGIVMIGNAPSALPNSLRPHSLWDCQAGPGHRHASRLCERSSKQRTSQESGRAVHIDRGHARGNAYCSSSHE